MSRSTTVNRLSRRARFRPTVQRLESRALLTTAGSVDTTFGGGTGYYLSPISATTNDNSRSQTGVATESDDSIIVASVTGSAGNQSLSVTHLTASGTLDTSFGTSGVGSIPSGSSLNSGNVKVLIQPNGQILVLALVDSTANTSNDETLVARFNADGSADTTFGTDGLVTIDPTSLGLTGGVFNLMAVEPDGQIVLAGGSDLPGSNPSSSFGPTMAEVIAVRLNTDGTTDTTFGTNGLVSFTNDPGAAAPNGEYVESLAVQANGQILIGTSTYVYDGMYPTVTAGLIRLNTDGSQDPSINSSAIGSGGIVNPDDLIVQPNGQILVFGTSGYDGNISAHPIITRLNADGTYDQSAVLPSAYASNSPDVLTMALAPDGDVVLITTTSDTPTAGTLDFITTRVTSNLVPDTSYGVDGVSQTNLTVPTQGEALGVAGLAIDSEGRIDVLSADGSTFAVARLTAVTSADSPTVYLPASGSFAIRPSTGGPDQIIPFGIPGAGQTIPAIGDYTGSGVEEIGAYLPSQGVYAYRPANGGPDVLQAFGIPGAGQSIPAPGDYFGTGQDDIAVYMPSIGSFGIRNPDGGPDEIIQFGIAGAGQSIPAPGDYFGTGQTDIAVYLPSLGAFAIRNPTNETDEIIPFGIPGAGNSIPIPGDYDGSGKTELAVYLPKLGEFAYRPANGGPDVIVPFGTPNDGSLPVPGDYDGSGKTEIAIYDPNYGSFAYRPADGGPDVIFAFGSPGVGQSIPTATLPGALPEFNGVTPVTVSAESAAPTIGLAVPSGPASKRISLLAVNQGDSDGTDSPV